jgi:mRNA-degrading endonuclease RelE of RelBE toxin-antitoxin system
VAVRLTAEGAADFAALPTVMKARVLAVQARLEQWPNVSGAKALSREWVGHRRIRTGDYRVIFRVQSSDVIIVRIQHRSAVYDP